MRHLRIDAGIPGVSAGLRSWPLIHAAKQEKMGLWIDSAQPFRINWGLVAARESDRVLPGNTCRCAFLQEKER